MCQRLSRGKLRRRLARELGVGLRRDGCYKAHMLCGVHRREAVILHRLRRRGRELVRGEVVLEPGVHRRGVEGRVVFDGLLARLVVVDVVLVGAGVVLRLHHDVRRAVGVHLLRAAEIERERAAYHDHDHGAEDADVREAHGVALHAVEHARDADEVLGLVVIAPVAAQRLQNRDGDGGEEAVGADYDGEDREEIHRHGHAGIVHEHGDDVARAEEEYPHQRQKPAGLRLLFTHIAASQQLHWT